MLCAYVRGHACVYVHCVVSKQKVCNAKRPYTTNLDECLYAVILFSQLWRRAVPGKELKPIEYWFPDNADELDTFIKKHDLITDQLDILAARDELLSGK